MSKKLLAALIAFSMVGAFGCTENEDDNNGGNGCTQNATRCDGNMPQMCIDGTWTNASNDCGAVGCNVATGKCNTNGGNNTNPGGNNNNPGGNNNNPGGNNNNPGGNNNNPGGDTTVGATCDPATYAGACSSDGSKRYYCDNTSSVIVEKPCNSGTVCEIQGVNSTKCVADPNCSATETKETSCSDGKDNDCDGWIDSNDHDCTGGSGNSGSTDCTGQLTEGGNVGDACNRNCYKQTCTNNGANALVCWDDVVTQWSCASTCQDAGYNPDKPLQVNCPKDGGSGNSGSTDCTGQLTEGGNVGDACNRNCYKQTCTNNGANALVCWDDVVTQWSCASTCQDAGYNPDKPLQVNCPKDGGSGGNDSGTLDLCSTTEGETCTKCQNVCDGLNGYYCDTTAGVIRKKVCQTSCAIVSNSVKCDETCSGTNVTTGGNVGDCCSSDTYQPTGCDTALRCNSKGVVVKWTCPSYSEPTKTECAFDPNDTAQYAGGKFSCVEPN